MSERETVVARNSTNIEEISFDADTDTLTIVFQGGDEYDYMNVPSQVFRAFAAAGSTGQYFYRHIKGRFAYDGPK